MTPLRLTRLGMLMEPQPGNPDEVEGVLNPAVIRAKNGDLFLFPRMVARGNYSRIGIARVVFDRAGDPKGVERLGVALSPEAEYELSESGGGCEDPRVSFVEPLQSYVMSYAALSRHGPRIAFAVSTDLFNWRRLGLATFHPYDGVGFDGIDEKDASVFPDLIPGPHGHPALALVHRPLFPETRPEEKVQHSRRWPADIHRESIWISYCRPRPQGRAPSLGEFVDHHRLAAPSAPWEKLKIGAGAPPILCRHGWLLVYHGVHALDDDAVSAEHKDRPRLAYSAGAMVLSRTAPSQIVYRWPEPVLTPEVPLECHGVKDDVVFPTGIDRRDDLGQPDRFDIYYGMADDRIGVARLDMPVELPRRDDHSRPIPAEAGSR
jgi:beta-1,2-mannobiose phosphorylase / 1,2-beta-oligomannan phosphorylase